MFHWYAKMESEEVESQHLGTIFGNVLLIKKEKKKTFEKSHEPKMPFRLELILVSL